VQSLEGPSSGKRGQSVLLTITIKNIGGGTAQACAVGLYLSKDAAIDPVKDRIIEGYASPSGLLSGRTSKKSITVLVPNDIEIGAYYLGAVIDLTRGIQESNKLNNFSTQGTLKKIQILE
jgi:subtilase family serine protease